MTTFSRIVLGLMNVILILVVIVGIAVLYNQAEELHELKTEISAIERRITHKLDNLSKSLKNSPNPPIGTRVGSPAGSLVPAPAKTGTDDPPVQRNTPGPDSR